LGITKSHAEFTHNGDDLIFVKNRGVRTAAPEVMAKLIRCEHKP
jgi:hypothetical protein